MHKQQSKKFFWNNANKNTAKVLIQLVDFPSWISFGILKNSEEALALGVFLQGLTVLPWGILSNSLIFIFDVFRSYFIQRDNEGKEKFQVEKFNKASGMIQMKTNIRLLASFLFKLILNSRRFDEDEELEVKVQCFRTPEKNLAIILVGMK